MIHPHFPRILQNWNVNPDVIVVPKTLLPDIEQWLKDNEIAYTTHLVPEIIWAEGWPRVGSNRNYRYGVTIPDENDKLMFALAWREELGSVQPLGEREGHLV